MNGVSAALSFVIPGLGQAAFGHIIRGLLWFVAAALGYACFIVPGLVIHVFCIIFALRIKTT